MDRSVFIKACQLAAQLKVFIDIGGGEPTLHPLLWDFIGITFRYRQNRAVCIVTNGKLKDEALELVRLGNRKVLQVYLSLDRFHEPIDYEVVKAFEDSELKTYVDTRDITNNNTVEPAPFGRAKSWASNKDLRCPGNDLHIASDGVIFACGCRAITYGTVFEPKLPNPLPDEWCPDKLG